MALWGGLPAFNGLVEATKGSFKTLTAAANGLSIGGVMAEDPSAVVSASTSITLTVNDHGKEYILTGGTTVTVTMPATSALFPGWKVRVTRQGAGRVDVVRAGSDTIISQGAALTTLSLPSVSDSGQLVADTANTRFFWRGYRSFESTEITPATSVNSSQAHSLGVLPKNYASFLRNKITELGFAVNDEVPIANAYDGGGSGRQRQLVMDATNGVFQTGTLSAVSVAGSVLNKTTPAGVISITTAGNWAMFWRAWVVN